MGRTAVENGLVAIFRTEALRRLDVLSRSVACLPASSPAERGAHLDAVREAAHGLKGSALTVGFEQAAAAAAELERLAVASVDGGGAPPLQRLETLVGELVTLCVDLPVEDVSLERRPASAAEVTRTVVCVEDDPASAALLGRLLAQRPWVEVVTATSAREGIEFVQGRRPDLVLLDLHLPDGTGEQVLTELKGDPSTSRIPVLVMTADAPGASAEQLRAAGAAGYLSKPLDLQQLLEIVDEHAGALP